MKMIIEFCDTENIDWMVFNAEQILDQVQNCDSLYPQ